MFQRPGIAIISMVIFSMAIAVFIGQWTTTGTMEMTSKAASDREKYNSVEDYSLDPNARAFSFETEDSCDSRRLYFLKSKEFAELPAEFRQTRSVQPAEFSRVCATYIMRHFGDVEAVIDGKKPSTANFSVCSHNGGTVEKTFWPPCVTEDYVNVVYNTFGDVMSCLGIPQKEFLPKFFLEGGLHLNGLGPQNDVGIGQLNESSIPLPESLKLIVDEINDRDEPSCERLKKPIAKLNFGFLENATANSSCEMIALPNNPLMSLILVAAKYKEDQKNIETYFKQKIDFHGEALDLEEMIRRSGLVDPKLVNREEMVQETYEKLKEIVVLQSYHLGPGKAAALLKNYFLDHLQKGVALQKSDFNFHINFDHFRGRMNARPLPAHLSYPEYVYIHFPPGSAGAKSYLVKMAEFADELNRKLKEGTCVSDSYLAL